MHGCGQAIRQDDLGPSPHSFLLVKIQMKSLIWEGGREGGGKKGRKRKRRNEREIKRRGKKD